MLYKVIPLQQEINVAFIQLARTLNDLKVFVEVGGYSGTSEQLADKLSDTKGTVIEVNKLDKIDFKSNTGLHQEVLVTLPKLVEQFFMQLHINRYWLTQTTPRDSGVKIEQQMETAFSTLLYLESLLSEWHIARGELFLKLISSTEAVISFMYDDKEYILNEPNTTFLHLNSNKYPIIKLASQKVLKVKGDFMSYNIDYKKESYIKENFDLLKVGVKSNPSVETQDVALSVKLYETLLPMSTAFIQSGQPELFYKLTRNLADAIGDVNNPVTAQFSKGIIDTITALEGGSNGR
jgi:hypothetical protein